MRLAVLVAVVALAGCSTRPDIKLCDPVPEYLLIVPEPPRGDLLQGATEREWAQKVMDLKINRDHLAGNLVAIRVHQAPCKDIH